MGVGGLNPCTLKDPMKKNGAIVALIVLAIVQLVAFGYRSTNAGPVGRRVGVGDDVSGLSIVDATGAERALATGATTIVLIFHSECGYCARVAPDWRIWLDEYRSDAAVLAVSSEPITDAAAYADKHGWNVDVGSMEVGVLGGQAHALTSRTPWIFIVDGAGLVLAEGHGNLLAKLAGGLRSEDNQ